MMMHVVLVQFAAGLVVCAVAGVAGGLSAAVTALLGTLACTVPNGLFALNLALLSQARRSAHPAGAAAPSALPLLMGELGKLLLTVGLLALLVWAYKNVVWLALIATVCAVLLVQPLALAWPRR